jgi:hypothetical protein
LSLVAPAATPPTTTPIPASATATATAAVLTWSGFVDGQGAAAGHLPVDASDGSLGFLVGLQMRRQVPAFPFDLCQMDLFGASDATPSAGRTHPQGRRQQFPAEKRRQKPR